MSITDELREFAKRWPCTYYIHKDLLAIADRIDVAHKHAIGYVDDRDPETMAENGWVRLPKDADGEYIHVGDEVWSLHPDIHFHVETMELTADGWEVDGCDTVNLHHYHSPTVKDVLRNVVTLCYNAWKEGSAFEFYDVDDVMNSGNIADFAAKLRLRED